MALKFLNKKGWHTGSLRNIENVWKAEQKRDAEEKKLDELRKQIHEERERAEFRLLQEQAGLVPRQERLDFLYDSGLAVGKGSSDGFKALETLPKSNSEAASTSSDKKQQEHQASVPGALFEEKPQSANDAWRKLHSDPLLLIRQREQEALARVKNNPVQMAMIRKSVEAKKHKDKTSDSKKLRKKHGKHSSAEQDIDLKKSSYEGGERRTSSHKRSMHDEHQKGASPEELGQRDFRRRGDSNSDLNYKKNGKQSEQTGEQREDGDRSRWNHGKSKHEKYHTEGRMRHEDTRQGRERRSPDVASRNEFHREQRNDRPSRKSPDDRPSRSNVHRRHSDRSSPDKASVNSLCLESRSDRRSDRPPCKSLDDRPLIKSPDVASRNEVNHKRRGDRPKLSEEERAARLREMQTDAELHEEQRWKRIKKAEEEDAQEASRASTTSGKNFLDAAQRSVYGAEKGGSSTIEESVRRRTHYLQGRSSEVSERNAFRR